MAEEAARRKAKAADDIIAEKIMRELDLVDPTALTAIVKQAGQHKEGEPLYPSEGKVVVCEKSVDKRASLGNFGERNWIWSPDVGEFMKVCQEPTAYFILVGHVHLESSIDGRGVMPLPVNLFEQLLDLKLLVLVRK